MNSSRRRKARELLVQALYARRVGGVELSHAIIDQVERRRPHSESLDYVRGLEEHLAGSDAERDALIDEHLASRSPERVGIVERMILHLGIVELQYETGIPTAVIIDEATHLVRTFSTEESVSFVHAILDRIARQLRTPRRAAE